MAQGCGRLYFWSLLYRPVPGVLKSGIPADTLIPAPVKNTIFLNFLSLIPLTSYSFEKVYFGAYLGAAAWFRVAFLSKASDSLFISSASFPSGNFTLLNLFLSRFICRLVMQLSQTQHQKEASLKLKAIGSLVYSQWLDMCPLTYLEQKDPVHFIQIHYSVESPQSLQADFKMPSPLKSRRLCIELIHATSICGQFLLGQTAKPTCPGTVVADALVAPSSFSIYLTFVLYLLLGAFKGCVFCLMRISRQNST